MLKWQWLNSSLLSLNHSPLNSAFPRARPRFFHHSFPFLSHSARNRSMASKIVAEYAKSGRSTCKKCAKSISQGSLRLGLIIKNPAGFDIQKWHHLNCFPLESQRFVAKEVSGISLLKGNDQDALKKLEAECNQKKVVYKVDASLEIAATDGNDDRSSKKLKTSHKEARDSTITNELAGHVEANELSGSSMGAELGATFSVSDIMNKYKDATLLPKWKAFQTVIFLEKDDGLHDSEKIAAFDFDGCLAKTSVKRVGPDAWSLLYPSIPDKLQKLYNDGYKLVIFTNESNIERWKNNRKKAVDSKIGRLNNFIKCVKVPIQVFIACGMEKNVDPYRKPKPGMWRLMEQLFNSGIKIDMDQSFYVGDAAGRVNDHSNADIGFAKANDS